MKRNAKPQWGFTFSTGPLRIEDVSLDKDGVATVKISDWPVRGQSWFTEELPGSPGSSGFTVATRVEPDMDGRLVAVEVRVFPTSWLGDNVHCGTWGVWEKAPHHVYGLTTSKMRQVLVHRAGSEAKKIIASFVDEYPETSAFRYLRDVMGWDQKARSRKASVDLSQRPGRKGRPDSEYLWIAVRYAELMKEGDPKPIKTLDAESPDGPAMTDLVRRCRARGLLTKTSRGIAGGTLTEKARGLLEEMNGDIDGES